MRGIVSGYSIKQTRKENELKKKSIKFDLSQDPQDIKIEMLRVGRNRGTFDECGDVKELGKIFILKIR